MTFVLFLAYLALWPLGIVLLFALLASLATKYRGITRGGLMWGAIPGVGLAIPFAYLGFGMTGGAAPGSEFLSALLKVFLAGFAAAGVIVWYFRRIRPLRRRSTV